MGTSAATVTPTDPGLDPAEAPRLSRQNRAILDLLRERPRWNHELAAVALSYTRRISDLRAHGYRVDILPSAAGTEHGARLYGLVLECPVCDGKGFYFYYNPPTPCTTCGAVGEMLCAPAKIPGCHLEATGGASC